MYTFVKDFINFATLVIDFQILKQICIENFVQLKKKM